jgi:hypothetical protein
MNETEVQGMLQELQQQVMLLSTRAAQYAGKLAVAEAKIKELTTPKE